MNILRKQDADIPTQKIFQFYKKYFQSESRCASVPIRGEWVTFLIRKSLTGRSGWRIMTENENMNLRVNRETIEMVTEKIRSVAISMNNHNRYSYARHAKL